MSFLFTLCTHASPDGAVYDPSNADQPFGFVEIKCPFSVRNLTPAEATRTPRFCCVTDDSFILFIYLLMLYSTSAEGL